MKWLLLFPVAVLGLGGEAVLGQTVSAPARPHPALRHDLNPAEQSKWEATAGPALALTPGELASRVPRQTPFITCDCPACGAQTFRRGPDPVTWEFRSPDQMTCRVCQTTFPNGQFPNNATSRFLNTRAATVEVACYQNGDGKKFYIDSAIDTLRSEELIRQTTALSKLYAVTKNDECAQRVAAVLTRYADVFPNYLVKEFRTVVDPPGAREQQRSWYEFVSTGGPWLVNGRPRGSKPSEPQASTQQTSLPYGWTQSRWGWGRWNGEMPLPLLHAYDLTCDAPAWDELSRQLGKDARRHVEQGLFREAAAYLMEYPFYYHIHNNAGTQIAELVRAGMVLNEPKFVEFGKRWGRSVIEQYAFSRDAAFGESPGYFYVFLATHADNYVALKEAVDYFGAGGDGSRDTAATEIRKATEFLERAQASIESVRFPNGSSLPVSDNRHDEFVDPTYRPGVRGTPRTSSIDAILPGYGHAMLGAGAGDRQVQAHLHFSPFKEVIHTHRDGLSLMLWAFGCELYTDIGYNRTKYRQFASTTLSHNTVVVDRKPQDGAETKGRLLAYEHDPRGWSFVQVENAQAYGPPVTRYRRSLLLNTRDLEAPYLVDVFEVRGGRMHDYALHGPTVFDSAADVDLPLVAMPGERPLLEPAEAAAFKLELHPYGLFSNVKAASANGDFAVTYRLRKPYELPEFTKNSRYPHGESFQYVVDPQAYADRGEIGVRSRFIGLESSQPGESWQVLLGETPSLLRGGLIGSPLTEKLKRPSLLLRHQGAGELSSVYVVVHEPYYREPKITAARLLKARAPNAVALEIETAGRVDIVLINLDGDGVTISAPSTATLRGKLGVVERSAGKQPEAWLVGGTSLQHEEVALSHATASFTGIIESASSVWDGAAENAFVTTATLPAGNALAGRWMIVHHGDGAADEGYRIAGIEQRGGKSVIQLTDDPGLRISGAATEEIFFPRRRWHGPNRFTILTQTAAP